MARGRGGDTGTRAWRLVAESQHLLQVRCMGGIITSLHRDTGWVMEGSQAGSQAECQPWPVAVVSKEEVPTSGRWRDLGLGAQWGLRAACAAGRGQESGRGWGLRDRRSQLRVRGVCEREGPSHGWVTRVWMME